MTPEETRAYHRRWRAENPTYFRDHQRRRRFHARRRLCPGSGGYACMVWLRPDQFLCSFCRRTVAL